MLSVSLQAKHCCKLRRLCGINVSSSLSSLSWWDPLRNPEPPPDPGSLRLPPSPHGPHVSFTLSQSLCCCRSQVVYDMSKGDAETSTLRPWLLNIHARAPLCPVIVVGTHIDKLPRGQCRQWDSKSASVSEVWNTNIKQIIKH